MGPNLWISADGARVEADAASGLLHGTAVLSF
jgi:hypothetical protein